MLKNSLKTYSNIFFIGIGGIGVSAIARKMLLSGKKVYGSDLNHSQILENLRIMGAHIFIGHNACNMPEDVDLVIYTIAVSNDNPEFLEAQRRGITTLTYSEALGLLTQEKKTIAVAGTHGKTTTTAMIAEILITAQKDPTVIVGSLLSMDRGNYIEGKGDFIVVEACEYRDSFLNLHPLVGVITNIDADHLDYFGSIENIQKSFKKFVDKIPKDGFLVVPINDENIKQALLGAVCKIIDYTPISTDFSLKVFGEHNKKNARAATAVARELGISDMAIKKGLEKFTGTWRRQEYKGKTKKGALVYDDYAHHPTEIEATIDAFKGAFPDKKISVIFQPHLFSRTKALFNDFVRVLSKTDMVTVTDIYAAREPEDKSITSQMLVDAINKKEKKAIYIKTFDEMVEKISKWAGGNDVVITVGAGDIYKVGERLVKNP